MKKTQGLFLLLVTLLGYACSNRPILQDKPLIAKREIIDDLGRSVTVPERIERVVSLAPNLTENVFAVGAGDRLVGVTTFCNFPDAARAIPKIGDTMTPNLETIVALKPDVVLVSTASQIETFSSTLASNGISVYVTDPDSIEGLFRGLTQLGRLFGTETKAGDVVADLRRRLKVVENRRPERSAPAFVQISDEPLFTIGKQSFLTEAIETVGARSLTADVESAYPKLSKETAAKLDPSIIILSESPDNREPNDVFRNSPAVRNDCIVHINADIISRPGARLIDALEQIETAVNDFRAAGKLKD